MTDIDQTKVEAFVDRVRGALVGAATVQMAHLGDRLGLYRTLAEKGPATPAELAARSGCAERYVEEWVAQQASAGFITYDAAAGRFFLPAENAAVLAMEDSPAAFAGAFEVVAGWHHAIDRLADAFRTGEGIPWGDQDPKVHDGTARFFGTAYRTALVKDWIPALALEPVLRRGALVADVGCGHGLTTLLLAGEYPESRFVGIDAHAPSIEEASKRTADAGASDNVDFEVANATAFAGGPYDVIMFFDSLHDLGDPVAAAAHARSQLAEGGTIVLVEPFALDEMTENIAGNPGAALHYTASTFLCVPHSLSEGGAALGAQAGQRSLGETLRAAGLNQIERVAATPLHAVYAARR